jgi:hypothetical protein
VSNLIIKPEISEAAEKAKRNAHQHERRRIALAILPSVITMPDLQESDVAVALDYADELLKATKTED